MAALGSGNLFFSKGYKYTFWISEEHLFDFFVVVVLFFLLNLQITIDYYVEYKVLPV